MWDRLSLLVARLDRSFAAQEEDERARLRRTTTTRIAAVVVMVSPIWIVTYLALGRPLSAALPAAYVLATVSSFSWLAWRRRLATFPVVQITLFATLPVLLQWSLGGFERGSAVALWSLSAPMLALAV